MRIFLVIKRIICKHQFGGKVCNFEGCRQTCRKCGKVVHSEDDSMNSAS